MSHYADAYIELTKVMLKAREARCEAEEGWLLDELDVIWKKLTAEDIARVNEWAKATL